MPHAWAPVRQDHTVNPSSALAAVLVDELVRGGVREAVLCPGSRSAPLAYALQDAERAGRLRLHVRVDERSAGFLALGLAKLSGTPAPVFTTSGTAVANLHPAVLEAHHAGVPLLLVTADRPPELRGTGANQTTEQVGIFGGAVRWSHDLGVPERRPGQNAVWRSVACRSLAAARGDDRVPAGPAHLNVPLREPLVPDGAAEADWPEALDGRADRRPWTVTEWAGTSTAQVGDCPRTLLVLGDVPSMQGDLTFDLARQVGWPVVAEPFAPHPARAVPRGPLLLTATEWLERHLPERVLLVGRPTLSRPVAALLRRPDVEVELVTAGLLPGEWPDPGPVVRKVHPWAALGTTDPTTFTVDADWAGSWQRAGHLVDQAAAEVLASRWPCGPSIAATVLGSVAHDAVIFAGSSNSVRDLDLAMSPAAVHVDQVVANRGLAGIDGCVSSAVGVALALGAEPAYLRDRPAYALMGDLTFLHDANGLLIGPQEPRPDLTIVVANDDGGGIFTTLEPGEPARAADFERIFGTPTGTSVADLCHAHGVAHRLAESRAQLQAAVRRRPEGLLVVEVPVPRDTHRGVRAALRSAAAEALTR